MPALGRPPKPPGHAVNRATKILDWIEVADVPFVGGMRLPNRDKDALPWSDEVVETWRDWSSMPHCVLWSKADWRFASVTLRVLAKYLKGGEIGAAAELRNREKVMGTTWDSRRQLRILYVDPAKTGKPTAVKALDDYRDL